MTCYSERTNPVVQLLALFATTHQEAYEAGRIIGLVFVGALALMALVGSVKCIGIANRPGTNARCVHGLMYILLAWVLHIAGGMIGVRGVMLVSVVVMVLALAVVGLVHVVKGLGEVRRDRQEYPHGRAHGIWAGVLVGLLLVLYAVLGIIAYASRHDDPDRDLAPIVHPQGSGEARFEPLNFVFNTPDKPWVRIDGKKLNAVCCFAMLRRGPAMYMMIIGETVDANATLTPGMLAEVITGNVRSAAESLHVAESAPHRVGNMDGVRIVMDSRIGGRDNTQVVWVRVRHGFAHQLHVWGPREHREQIIQESERVFACFRLIDPDRVFGVAGTSTQP